ncbi:Pleckstrin-likey domain-containing family H member 1 [Dirofilaria immitis]|nr:Pleckstrin-likey domain-containing family H member 1 [Dirofilaria immitis]
MSNAKVEQLMSKMNTPCPDISFETTAVSQKTAKIKRWIKNRLQEDSTKEEKDIMKLLHNNEFMEKRRKGFMVERCQSGEWKIPRRGYSTLGMLEKQNERLRLQNLNCTAQLQVLKSCADRAKHWQTSALFSSSVTTENEISSFEIKTLETDDNGFGRILMNVGISMYARNIGVLGSLSLLMMDRASDDSVRMHTLSQGKGEKPSDETSSTTDSSPHEEKVKPIPTPRKTKPSGPLDPITIERDSLNSYDEENDYREDIEFFDEIEYSESPEKDIADYVNLNELFLLRSDTYSTMIQHPPALPLHKPPSQWETKLYQIAERCLSTVINEDQLAQCSGIFNRNMSDNTSDLCSSPSRGSAESSRSSNQHKSRIDFTSIKEGDYAVPPDASQDIRATLINSTEPVEKCGYLVQMTDNRLKSLKRRYFVFRNDFLALYRTQIFVNEFSEKSFKNEEPLIRIAVPDIRSVTKLVNKMGYGLQITTASSEYCYAAESDRATDEWIAVLTRSLRTATISEVSQRAIGLNADINGYVIKVKCGSTRRFFASVVNNKLLFFKSSDDRVPCSHIYLQGAHICEKIKTSADESSGSSDEQNENNIREFDHTISIECRRKRQMDLFFKKAANNALLNGTAFEILVQRMMMQNVDDENPLWNDVLLTTCEEKPKETLIAMLDETLKKKALELGRACFMFTSVLMRPTGVQYHIDLAQNILTTAMSNDLLKNELYANLIKLTSGFMSYGIQAWKLMALTTPLFTPVSIPFCGCFVDTLRDGVEKGLDLYFCVKCDEGNFALYCLRAFNRCLKARERTEGPSKLEAISVLTRDPTSTNMPHSISVLLPTNEYQVIDFDGSTLIGDCLSTLCMKCGLRPALLSGYALYVEDPLERNSYLLLKNKQKLCDCISRWEHELMDNKCGRITDDAARIKLSFRQRHYWSHLVSSETAMERTFLVHRMANEIVGGRVPLSNELAEELAAVYAQLKFGNIKTISDEQFREIITSYYPSKLLDVGCERLLNGLHSHDTSCFTEVAFFGSFVMEARMKMRNDESLFIALNDQGVHLLTYRQLDLIRSIPYHRLVSFGGYHNDFMLTIERVLPPQAHPEETTRERLTFSMSSKNIDQPTSAFLFILRIQLGYFAAPDIQNSLKLVEVDN